VKTYTCEIVIVMMPFTFSFLLNNYDVFHPGNNETVRALEKNVLPCLSLKPCTQLTMTY